MNQDPPVLQPIDEKEFFNSIENPSLDKTQNSENRFNGYMTNGSGTMSPPMPILYQADREPPNLLNIQDIFSALARDDFDSNNADYSKSTPRKESDSFFEKIYKDYSTTLTNSSNIIDSVKDSTVSPQDTVASELNYSKHDIEIKSELSNNNAEPVHEKTLMKSDSLKSAAKVTSTKRSKRTRPKIISESVTEEVGVKKFGIKSVSAKEKLSGNNKLTPTKTACVNKYLKSPYITLRHGTPKKQCQTVSVISKEYEIINPALRGNGEYQLSSVYRPNLKSVCNNQISNTHPCICAFCGKTSEFLQLGNLYGPYFIDTENISGLPLTCMFPSDNEQDNQQSVVGASGKSAIKTDKNGGLKMVIQSSKSVRNSTVKKSASEDYRITWDGEVWFHRECILWAPCTYLRGDGKIGGLEEALKMALNAECCVCHKIGAILNCTTKNCDKNFHYYCAVSLGSKLNQEQFSMLCNKHKEKW